MRNLLSAQLVLDVAFSIEHGVALSPSTMLVCLVVDVQHDRRDLRVQL